MPKGIQILYFQHIFLLHLQKRKEKKAMENNYGSNQVTTKTYLISGHTLLKLQL